MADMIDQTADKTADLIDCLESVAMELDITDGLKYAGTIDHLRTIAGNLKGLKLTALARGIREE
jgi:hypothetical protein